MALEVEEWDITRQSSQDLSQPTLQEELLRKIRQGNFNAVFVSPPCNTWSRAPHSNEWGPRPIRHRQWPWGFPWLSNRHRELADLGNALVQLCFTIFELVADDSSLAHVLLVWGHPEDLGMGYNHRHQPVYPASVWQLEVSQRLHVTPPFFGVAFFQCQFGVDRSKPTRLLTNIPELHQLGYVGPPTFNQEDVYQGPLPSQCSHGSHPPLIKTSPDETGFRTTGTGVYPHLMEIAIAEAMVTAFLTQSSHPSEGLQNSMTGSERQVDGNQGVGDVKSGSSVNKDNNERDRAPAQGSLKRKEAGLAEAKWSQKRGNVFSPLKACTRER